MNKITATCAVIAGLFGLALTTRADISFSLPTGCVLIVLCGLLFYISLSIQKSTNENRYKFLLDSLSLKDIKSALSTISLATQELLVTQNKFNKQIVGDLSAKYDATLKINSLLAQLTEEIQSYLKTFAEQQQNLNEIVLEDIRETLTDFTKNQSENAEDFADSIKRTMNETNRSLHDLPLSLDKFSIQNLETMQKAAEGFSHFENLVNATIDQLTTLSSQDYELLKGILE